jgi:regulator of protease activity HflC (stomatin/prohibitin superfamily)
MAFIGAVAAAAGGVALRNLVLLDAAVTLAVSTGVLAGVALAQSARTLAARTNNTQNLSESPAAVDSAAPTTIAADQPASTDTSLLNGGSTVKAGTVETVVRILQRSGKIKNAGPGALLNFRSGVGAAGLVAAFLPLCLDFSSTSPSTSPSLLMAAIASALCFCGVGLAVAAVLYLAAVPPASLPEAPGLCRGARVVAWVLVLAGLSIGVAWMNGQVLVRILHFTILSLNLAVCGSLITKPTVVAAAGSLPLDMAVLSIFGNRANFLASILDAGERQLGIDLRSTWALMVVRRSAEPLLIGLCLMGWLSTTLTVVGVDEQGLVERLGVPVGGELLPSGIHLHWPWPVDRVIRIPVRQVQTVSVGHEGEEGNGPEDVLWARQHAAKEYTLLLGDGRDLITIDAALQFRIADARAWRYNTQNPPAALRAIAYRAVMRSTVNRTLSDALSENVAKLTEHMRSVVQEDADALGLGIEVMGFTVGGMHPPVPVAADYQAVVSAEVGKVTAVVDAQAYRNRILPSAEADVLIALNTARSQGAKALGTAAGDAWGFRTLEAQYRASPLEYRFRRRLEALEKGLTGRSYTIVDSRYLRDGGELWVVP